MCISNLIAYILQMARSNVFNCTYPGTNLLNNYPTLKKSPLNRTLVHGACVKARLHTGSPEMQAKRRRPWLLLPKKTVSISVTNSMA